MSFLNVGEKTLVFQVVNGCMCDGCFRKVRKNLRGIHGKLSIDYNPGEGKLTIQGCNLNSNMLIIELGNIKKKVELVTEDNATIDQVEEKQFKKYVELVTEDNATIDQVEEKQFNKNVELITEDNATIDQVEERQIFLKRKRVEEKQIIAHEGKLSMVVHNSALTKNKVLLHEKEVLKEEARAVVVNKPPYNQVVSLSAASQGNFNLDHEHDLELKQYDKRFTCNGCKEEGFRTRYRCKHCDYELHEDCMKPKPTVSHDLFKGCIFKFSREKPTCGNLCRVHTKSCEACGNGIHGYSYHCEAKGLYIHPRCINFTRKLCIQGETFILKNKATSKCFWCIGTENRINSGWSYVSKGDKGQLHVNCMARIAHEAWKERAIGGSDDAYFLVLEKRFNLGIVKNTKGNGWSRGGKILKMIMVFARTIIGILLGDPTVILASMFVEVLKK